MNLPTQSMPCPACNSTILFDTQQLLAGVEFGCPDCHASIGLAPQSKKVVAEAMQKLETLKENPQQAINS
jgi:transcription initiation factor IIE alpha subunit